MFASKKTREIALQKWEPLSVNDTIFKLLEKLGKEHVQRIGIVDSESKCVSFATQSQVLRWIYEKGKDSFDVVKLQLPVNTLLPESQEVFTSLDTEPVIEAFTQLTTKKVHSIAIVNKEGHFVNFISDRDLKALEGETVFKKMFTNTVQFVKEAQRLHSKNSGKLPLYVTPDLDMETLMDVFQQYHCHRLYIVDNKKPLGVVTLGDVLSLVFQDNLPAQPNKNKN